MSVALSTSVESNIDALSGEVLHLALVKLVDDLMRRGAEFLRGIVPKETGALAEHVGSKEAHEIAGIIEGRLGITEIHEAGGYGAGLPHPGEQQRSHSPLFVDRGTGIFGPTHSPIFARRGGPMVFESGGHTVFAYSVKGQPGQHFMAETLAFVEAMLRTDLSIREALDEMAARARSERLA